MKRALITGSAGFVGLKLRRRLEADGWLVFGCDLTNGYDCRTLFARDHYGYDLAFHCAAVVGGRQTISNDPMAVAVDLELDAAFFRWAVRTHQPRVVYFSSSAAYPTSLQVPGRRLREDDIDLDAGPLGIPDKTYGWSKLTGELLARYAEAEGVKVHVARPFSGWGEDQALDYPMPAYIARALRRDDPFTVWGDGQQARDFIHIDDVIGCVLAAVEQDYREPLNIGTGRATTFDELARLVCAGVGFDPTIAHDLSQPVGPSWRVADVSRMAQVYTPRITLEEGVQRALRQAAAA